MAWALEWAVEWAAAMGLLKGESWVQVKGLRRAAAKAEGWAVVSALVLE
jgi:hypothetical protein